MSRQTLDMNDRNESGAASTLLTLIVSSSTYVDFHHFHELHHHPGMALLVASSVRFFGRNDNFPEYPRSKY
jgi:hypothetical protein